MRAKFSPVGNRVEKKSKISRNRADTEFLPAALEILEGPPSPIRVAGLWFICTLAVTALSWGWFGKFDIVATAQGKIQPAGRVKIIQSLESGKTKFVPVTNGMPVRAGDVVVALDDSAIAAEETAKTGLLLASTTEVVRSAALISWIAQRKHHGDADDASALSVPTLVFSEEVPGLRRAREQAVFEAELHAISTSLASLSAQRGQRQAEIEGLKKAIEAQESLVETLRERVTMRSKLLHSESGSKAQMIDAVQEQQEAVATLSDKRAQLETATAALVVATAERLKLLDTASADNASRKLKAEHTIDELVQEIIRIRKRRELLTIRSPVDGVVQLSSIATVGQVVSPNVEIMRIVPSDAVLEIEAYLPNRDIGFVTEGQPVIVKVEAYPFTRFGIIEGAVARISTDAVPEPDAQQIESTILQSASSTIPTGNVPRVQNLVFPVTLRLNSFTLPVEGRSMPLATGMAVTVEIKTGERRILEYLFSPLSQITSEAMKER